MQLDRASHRPWEITPDDGGTLRVGHRHLRLDQIRSVAPAVSEERDILASMLNLSTYLTIAAVMMIVVIQAGWRERFLLAAVFFALIAYSSLADIWQANRIRLYTVTIGLADGTSQPFTTAAAAEADRMIEALRRAGHA